MDETHECELLVTEQGYACLPVESLRPLFSPCGAAATQQLQAVSGEIVWVCDMHWAKAKALEAVIQ
jgi:hypothetical protein